MALARITDALHITHHATDTLPKCELAAAVLASVRGELGDGFGAAEEAFCDPACLQRYLRARSMDVGCAGGRGGRRRGGARALRGANCTHVLRRGPHWRPAQPAANAPSRVRSKASAMLKATLVWRREIGVGARGAAGG